MAALKPTVFRYKPIGERLAPMVSMGVKLMDAWHRVELYADSGAAYSILRAQFASDIGFDYRTGRKVFVQVGDGSHIPVFLHKLPLQIGAKRFDATVGFSDKLGVRFHLLGRLEVFEHFKICFMEKRRIVTFQPVR